jgi:hypothetical protein
MRLTKKARGILLIIGWLICMGIWAYIEIDFQNDYQERSEQQKVEHEFYESYKDSINDKTRR